MDEFKVRSKDGVLSLSISELIATLLDNANMHGRRLLLLTFDKETDEIESIACLPLSNDRTRVLLQKSIDTLDETVNSYELAKIPGTEDITPATDEKRKLH